MSRRRVTWTFVALNVAAAAFHFYLGSMHWVALNGLVAMFLMREVTES